MQQDTDASDRVSVTLDMFLKPQAVSAFCESLPALLLDTAKQPGAISVRVVRHKEQSNRVLFIESWASEQSYHDYVAWRTERGDMAALGAALAAPPTLDIWPATIASF